LFRRIPGRRGEQKAIMAVAHQMLNDHFSHSSGRERLQRTGREFLRSPQQAEGHAEAVERLYRLGYCVDVTLQTIEKPVQPRAAEANMDLLRQLLPENAQQRPDAPTVSP
jgi:hypothetical protein